MKRWGTRLDAAIYRLTRGRVLGRVGGQPVLLLETLGRRTGRRHGTPVQYLADGETFFVVASNAGARRLPDWYLNLRVNPHARLQAGARTIDVRAREITGRERAGLWKRMTTANRYLQRAARKAGRELPLIALVPSTPTTSRRAARSGAQGGPPGEQEDAGARDRPEGGNRSASGGR
jgi:F420H(2)-dependent quinone reductase